MRGGLNVISSKIALATFYKVRHQIRDVRVATIMTANHHPDGRMSRGAAPSPLAPRLHITPDAS
jgi:hypothetical protein